MTNHLPISATRAYEVFFEALQHNSVQDLIRIASEFFDCPILCTDSHYRLVAIYPQKEIGDYVYDTLLRENVLPEELVKSFQYTYLSEPDTVYDPFYRNDELVKDCPRIFGEVYSGKTIHGHFAIMMRDKPLSDQHLPCATILQKALEFVMTRQALFHEDASEYLADLLQTATTDVMRQFARRELQKTVSPEYYLRVIPIGASAQERALASMKTGVFNNRTAVSAIYKECLVTLYGNMTQYTEAQAKDSLIRDSAKLAIAGSAGFSIRFSDLQTIIDRFTEAYLSARMSGKTYSFFPCENGLAFPGAICSRINTGIFVHPALSEIQQYDTLNDTEYYHTLRIYSYCLRSKEKTSERLHIHRNTLLYRLNRIRDVFSVDMEDDATALAVINSYQILDGREMRKHVHLCED